MTIIGIILLSILLLILIIGYIHMLFNYPGLFVISLLFIIPAVYMLYVSK